MRTGQRQPFLLVLLLFFSLWSGLPSYAQNYTNRLDVSFQSASDAGPGTSDNYSDIGNGLLARKASTWGIRSGVVKPVNNTNADPLGTPLYFAGTNGQFADGRVTLENPALSSSGNGFLARYNPSNNTGYSGFTYGASVYFNINGAQSSGYPIGANVNVDHRAIWECKSVDDNTTQITVRFYNKASPPVQIGNTITLTDTTPSLQKAAGRTGYWGIATFGADSTQGIVIDQITPGGDYTTPPGVAAVSIFRTLADLSITAPGGGDGSNSYQVYLSETAGQTGNLAPIISGTTFTPRIGPLTPGKTYYVTVRASDGAHSIDSAPLVFTTVKSLDQGGHVIMFTGDSITFGVGNLAYPARMAAIDRLRSLGISCEGVNNGQSGIWTAAYSPNVALAQQYGADVVSIMSGTNDVDNSPDAAASGRPKSPTQYRADILALCDTYLAPGTGIRFIILHDCIGRGGGSGTAEQQATVALYNQQLDDIAANSSRGGRIIRGDTTMLAYANAHQAPDEFGDLHPGAAGHLVLGNAWGDAVYTFFRSIKANVYRAAPNPQRASRPITRSKGRGL